MLFVILIKLLILVAFLCAQSKYLLYQVSNGGGNIKRVTDISKEFIIKNFLKLISRPDLKFFDNYQGTPKILGRIEIDIVHLEKPEMLLKIYIF